MACRSRRRPRTDSGSLNAIVNSEQRATHFVGSIPALSESRPGARAPLCLSQGEPDHLLENTATPNGGRGKRPPPNRQPAEAAIDRVLPRGEDTARSMPRVVSVSADAGLNRCRGLDRQIRTLRLPGVNAGPTRPAAEKGGEPPSTILRTHSFASTLLQSRNAPHSSTGRRFLSCPRPTAVLSFQAARYRLQQMLP